MKLKSKIVLSVTLICILLISVAGWYLFVFDEGKKFKKEIKATHTIKTGELVTKKLVTAAQFVDFVTVLISGDRKNEYIEYQTYKIEAGVDVKKDRNTVCIVNKPIQIDRTVLKSNLAAEKYDSYIKPIQSAYDMKACDIAVKYNLLENAEKNITQEERKYLELSDELVLAKTARNDVKYLPCYFETSGNILSDDLKSFDFEFINPENSFSRDAVEINIKGTGIKLQMGYTGKKFEADTFATFRERLQKENKDITVFKYFDPLDDKNTKQVLSYATDGYQTAFILHGGKLYYITFPLVGIDNQTKENLGRIVLYLAMSVQFDDEKSDISNEYMKYIEDFDYALSLLGNKKYPEFKNTVVDMLNQKSAYKAISNETLFDNALTNDEEILLKTANYFIHLEDDSFSENKEIKNEFDSLLQNCRYLYNSHQKEGSYTDVESRNAILNEISSRGAKNKNEVRANMLTYFLQNSSTFGLDDDTKKDYLSELVQTGYSVDRTILESFDTDRERNEFYARLFKNAAGNNNVQEATSEIHPDMTFFFIGDTKDKVGGSGILDKKLLERNGGIPLGNVFVLIFSESNLPILSSSRDSENKVIQFFKDIGKSADNITQSVHALVFDNCSVRLFACLDDDSVFEFFVKGISMARRFISQSRTIKIGNVLSGSPEFIYFWDWRGMNIYKNGTAFLGYDYSNTANYDVVGNRIFQATNRASEIRTVGEILLQLQNAYESNDFHFELALDFVERELRNYIYNQLWRPSLRISEADVDRMERYNFIWMD